MQSYKEAFGLYGKSFPFFNDLSPVFGKDRAYGNSKGDIGDDTAQYEHGNHISLVEGIGLSQVTIDDIPMPMQEPTQSPPHLLFDNSTSTTSRHKKKKRKVMIRIQP